MPNLKKEGNKIGEEAVNGIMDFFTNIGKNVENLIKGDDKSTYGEYLDSITEENFPKEKKVKMKMQLAQRFDRNFHLKDVDPNWLEMMMTSEYDDIDLSLARAYIDWKPIKWDTHTKNILDQMDPDILQGFKNHKFNYHNSEIATTYSNNYSEDLYKLTDKHMVEYYNKTGNAPARFVGFLEDNPELYQDVILASEETGVNPASLYMIYMQEGGAEMDPAIDYYNETQGQPLYTNTPPETPRYKGDIYIDTFGDIGLDAFLDERDLATQRGYLNKDSPIKTHKELLKEQAIRDINAGLDAGFSPDRVGSNEAGFVSTHGDIQMQDAVRGVGAVMRLNQDYLRDHFLEGGIEFDTMSERQKVFWTYAAVNAGHVETKKLFDTYGANPLENEEFFKTLYENPATLDADVRKQAYRFQKWMKNVLRVTGGYDMMDKFDAFNLEKESLR